MVTPSPASLVCAVLVCAVLALRALWVWVLEFFSQLPPSGVFPPMGGLGGSDAHRARDRDRACVA